MVATRGTGIDGIGAVATKRVSVLHRVDQACVFISDAGTEDVAGISIARLRSMGVFKASPTDNASFGLGIVQNGRYLYANFTGSKTIATYRMERDCRLSFLGDTPAAGLAGFAIIDMAVHPNLLVASFFDGSTESFDISSGQPIANGDLQC